MSKQYVWVTDRKAYIIDGETIRNDLRVVSKVFGSNVVMEPSFDEFVAGDYSNMIVISFDKVTITIYKINPGLSRYEVK